MKKALIGTLLILFILGTSGCQSSTSNQTQATTSDTSDKTSAEVSEQISSEIPLTVENIEDFYNIEFYTNNYSASYGYSSATLVAVIEPKALPGTFKLPCCKLQLSLTPSNLANLTDALRQANAWKFGDPLYESTGNESSSTSTTSGLLELPNTGSKSYSFSLVNKGTREVNTVGNKIVYKFINVSGSYVPAPNEDISTYK